MPPRLSPPKYFLYGIPTVCFSLISFYTLNKFISGANNTRSLTRLTSKSEREARLEKELEDARKKAFREEVEGEYSFGKRIER
jgi:hypothetical protein